MGLIRILKANNLEYPASISYANGIPAMQIKADSMLASFLPLCEAIPMRQSSYSALRSAQENPSKPTFLENGSSLILKLTFKNTLSQLVIWSVERGLPTVGTKRELKLNLQQWCQDNWTGLCWSKI